MTEPLPSIESSAWRFWLVALCFVLSGMAGLIYETAWSQEFGLVFGTTEMAIVVVLAAYMAGLAGGAALASRMIHRSRRPLLTYAVLELGIGAFALLVPFLIRAAGKLQISMLGDNDFSGGHTIGLVVFDMLSSFAILLVPTAMMGATLPLLARHAVRTDAQIGPRVGWLYTANTFGAAVGALGATFLLLPNMGLGQTIWVAVALNLTVFLLAVPLGRDSSVPRTQNQAKVSRLRFHWILPAVLISGAVSFSLEITWTRLLAHIFGGSLYAFGTMLATYLIAIAAGAATASRFARNRRSAMIGFALCQLGVGLFSIGSFVFANQLPALLPSAPETGLVPPRSAFMLSAVAMFPAAFCSGATFPFAIRLFAKDAASSGSASGQVYAWNTVGCIAGILLTGLWMLPAFQFSGTVTITIATSLMLAAAALWSIDEEKGKARRAACVPVLIIAAVLIWPVPTPTRLLQFSPLSGLGKVVELEHLAVGRSATVSVRPFGGDWRISTNGLPESIIEGQGKVRRNLAVAKWLSMLPHAVRPEMERSLVIGFGAGVTGMAAPATVKDVTIVELEPEMVQANQMLAKRRRQNPFADPRLSLVIDDARGALMRTNQRFDAIISQPSHPWTGGAANLFTQEFFEITAARLTSDGVFIQWLGLQFVDEALIRTTVATLASVFENVEVYSPSNRTALLFLASNGPLFDSSVAARSIEIAPQNWHELGVFRPVDILAIKELDAVDARQFSEAAAINRDRRNLLKINSPKVIDINRSSKYLDQLFRAYNPLQKEDHLDWSYVARRYLERGQVLKTRQLLPKIQDANQRATILGLIAIAENKTKQGLPRLLQSLARNPNQPDAMAALLLQYRNPFRQNGVPEKLKSQLKNEGKIFLEIWQAESEGDWQTVSTYESTLSAWPADHAFYRLALLERVRWRLHLFEPHHQAEIEPLMNELLGRATTPFDILALIQWGMVTQNKALTTEGFQKLGERLTVIKPRAARSLKARVTRETQTFFQQLSPSQKAWSHQNLNTWLIAPERPRANQARP